MSWAGPEDIYLSTSLASYLDNMLTKVQRKLNFRKEKEKLDGAFGEWKDYTSKSARWQGEKVDTRRRCSFLTLREGNINISDTPMTSKDIDKIRKGKTSHRRNRRVGLGEVPRHYDR
ncbi:Sm-like protein LSM1B [Camellia lanceoleosa]|uniref:Sm-like protein LSM1B n=1 Tax=Camellia lanceoleosa TaxID=1840588 RepID=A0ACC0HU36_9ERIC|nr:Sm-like protein LSM1B [Camellia lanceoleosa]